MKNFSHISLNNLDYLEELYNKYLENPESVEQKWRYFFDGIEFQKDSLFKEKKDKLFSLLSYYREQAHLYAQINPLKENKSKIPLDLFEIEEKDLKKNFPFRGENKTLEEIISLLEKSYKASLSVQCSYCEDEIKKWIYEEFERKEESLSPDKRLEVYRQLVRTESLENFIHKKYVGAKRFSIEGADSLIPLLEKIIEISIEDNAKEIILGMSHRGRLNVLTNIMNKKTSVLFAKFDGFDHKDFDGDVKYHLGYSSDRKTPSHKNLHLSLCFNPSHLESVNPVLSGMVRAKQRIYKDTKKRQSVLPVLIHGDASFIGQGVVSETLQLSDLEGYKTGGSLHIILDNQIGFTTSPKDARTSLYSSDLALSIKSPVLLVNGDDVEACLKAAKIALNFRKKFQKDIFIHLFCYRRFGHNESDEPSFTQPLMYEKIKKKKTPRQIYLEKLEKLNVLSLEKGEKIFNDQMNEHQKALEEVRKSPPKIPLQSFKGRWEGFKLAEKKDFEEKIPTGVKKEVLNELLELLFKVEKDFKLHPKIKKFISQKEEKIKNNKLDWALGELLTYASLKHENYSVRLSGQDSKRGTFSHRHACFFDYETGKEHCPLEHIPSPDSEFCVYNSPLSEMAVLGFEYGNSLSDPYFLIIWEAQFGDFFNGAQIIIDQFITSGEQKWMRSSGITLFLPHGYEGQGPEHSSARIERFLQMCAQNNIQVCNPTTPSNLFHLLRRQMKRKFRKPLVVLTPKSLLRHPEVYSSLEDFTKGSFKEVICKADLSKVESLVLCSGKIYYDLKKEENEKKAIIRIEQAYPFPRTSLIPLIQSASYLKQIIWIQEEPKNMGFWFFMKEHLQNLMKELKIDVPILYKGRTERSSPAVGSLKRHEIEQKEIIESFKQIK